MNPHSPSATGPRARHAANRLAKESSPYLLQHAHNPVDWFPWGPEAFEEARRRNVPIFLSIGYSTCYWCHVMERESFEDPATAELMNRLFVNVKVDREERPDVDELYMAAVQTLTGGGGWPMSVFLEPATLKPFYAGTYFPPRPAHGRPSFSQVLTGLAEAFVHQAADIRAQADAVAQAVGEHLAAAPAPVRLSRSQVEAAVQTLLTIFDPTHGGFGRAPKFPQPVYLEFLLDVRGHVAGETVQAIDRAVRTTLDRMAMGGLFDQVAGGFHRYSVDHLWLVPHFEKMLYDNAQLLSVYARAAQVYADGFYRRVARRTADYILAELREPTGALRTAQDAEVNGREGQNYLWTSEQLRETLGPDDGPWAARVYGVDRGPNFQDPHHPHDPPSNVLHLIDHPDRLASALGLSLDAFWARLDSVNQRLLAQRARRQAPRLDDKVLTAWNGLAIAALADAARLLDSPSDLLAARQAAQDLLCRHVHPELGLLRASRGGAARIPAMLEDYAMFALGLLALARAEGAAPGGANSASAWREHARVLIDQAIARFDDQRGGLVDVQASSPELFVKPRSTYDGAMPSGISILLHALVELGEQLGDSARARQAGGLLASISALVAESPIARVNSVRALPRLLTAAAGALADEAPGATPPAGGPARSQAGAAPVVIYASEEQVLLEPDEPQSFMLRLDIAEPYHLIAADPGAPGLNLAPTRLIAIGGGGVAVYADYPLGEPLDPADPRSPRVYRGSISFEVALERVGEWTGRPALALVAQACTDRECLLPVTLPLEVELRRVNG
jgi:uncharacterized protein YyaL (SSP411 family)